MVGTLSSAEPTSRHTCAQVIAKIARIEFPAGEWPELIPGLLSNVTKEGSPPGLVQASLQSLGYFCEEIDSGDVQQDAVNSILTAIVDGMKPSKPVHRDARLGYLCDGCGCGAGAGTAIKFRL